MGKSRLCVYHDIPRRNEECRRDPPLKNTKNLVIADFCGGKFGRGRGRGMVKREKRKTFFSIVTDGSFWFEGNSRSIDFTWVYHAISFSFFF